MDLSSSVGKRSLIWDGSTATERGKLRPYSAAEQSKKITRKLSGYHSGYHIYFPQRINNKLLHVHLQFESLVVKLPSFWVTKPVGWKTSWGSSHFRLLSNWPINTQDQSLGKNFTPTCSILPIIALKEAVSVHCTCASWTAHQCRCSPT